MYAPPAGGGSGGRGTGDAGKAPLSPQDEGKFEKLRALALSDIMNPDCLDFLVESGIDPTMVQVGMMYQQAFNGNRSTITMQDAGLMNPLEPGYDVDAYNRTSALSVSRYFRVNFNTNGVSQLGGSDVYFRQGKISEGNIMHEALHNAGYSDAYLMTKFNIPDTAATGEINNKLKDNGCIR